MSNKLYYIQSQRLKKANHKTCRFEIWIAKYKPSFFSVMNSLSGILPVYLQNVSQTGSLSVKVASEGGLNIRWAGETEESRSEVKIHHFLRYETI